MTISSDAVLEAWKRHSRGLLTTRHSAQQLLRSIMDTPEAGYMHLEFEDIREHWSSVFNRSTYELVFAVPFLTTGNRPLYVTVRNRKHWREDVSPRLWEQFIDYDNNGGGSAVRPRTLYSAADVAAKLGISQSRVRALAQSRGLGQQPIPRTWVFTDADLDAMRDRKPGRPAKPASP